MFQGLIYNEQLKVNDRKCPFCIQDVETELHALLKCKEYVDIRNVLFEKASSIESNFRNFTDIEKLKFLSPVMLVKIIRF